LYSSPGIWGSGILFETGRSIPGIHNKQVLVKNISEYLLWLLLEYRMLKSVATACQRFRTNSITDFTGWIISLW
jgi:hypothetical protein